MAHIGQCLPEDVLVFTEDCDFFCSLRFSDKDGLDIDINQGDLSIQWDSGDEWFFDIEGPKATLNVAWAEVSHIPNRSRWKLVFTPVSANTPKQALAIGHVRFQK